MSIAVGNHSFSRASYDPENDVLYLENADPSLAVRWVDTREGDSVSFDASDALIGITVLDIRWRLQSSGQITLTLPDSDEQLVLGRAEFEQADAVS